MTQNAFDIDDLVLKIHSAALAEDGWGEVGNHLCRALDADCGVGIRIPSRAHPKVWAMMINFDPAAAQLYSEHWGQHDVWYDGARRTGRTRTGMVSVDSQFATRRDLNASAFFNEYLKPNDVGSMINVCLAGTEHDHGFGVATLSLHRGVGKEPFSAESAKLLSYLAPHLAIAIQNHWTAQSLRLLIHAHTGAMNSLTSAVFGLESSRRVAFTNQIGEEVIRQQRWVKVTDGTLEPAEGVAEACPLLTALGQLSCGTSFKILVTDRLSGCRAVVSGAPLPKSGLNLYSPTIEALVWVTPIIPNTDVATDFKRLFGLTRAEQRLIGSLIAGRSLRAAAMELHISVYTARTQLKAIFNKTGLRTQAALMTFIGRLSALQMPI